MMLPILELSHFLPIIDESRVWRASRDFERPACADMLANDLAARGWHGTDNRLMWSIVWRESRNDPTVSGNGGYGLTQIQASVWSSAPWWDWDTVLTRAGNLRMARALYNEHGYRAWGVKRVGDGWAIDSRDYAGWSSDQVQAWIKDPITLFWGMYPCEVAP
jgi:hypothetical protein